MKKIQISQEQSFILKATGADVTFTAIAADGTATPVDLKKSLYAVGLLPANDGQRTDKAPKNFKRKSYNPQIKYYIYGNTNKPSVYVCS